MKRRHLKAVIFDVDGVLVDSKEANVMMYQNILKAGGYPAARREDILQCFHLTLWHSLEKLTGQKDRKEIERLFKLAKQPTIRAPYLMEFPDKLEDTLEKLHTQYKLAIVTSRIKIGVDEIFSVRKLHHLFDAIVTFEDYSNPKPDPEPLVVALARLKIKPDEAVYIGDSDSDIDAANAAGVRSIHLNRTFHPNATSGIKEFQELLSAVQKLL